MYNISIVYGGEEKLSGNIFNHVTSWRFSDDGFLVLHWIPDTTLFISKNSIWKMRIDEVKEE